MKEILDRHAEELSAAERDAMWRAISGSRAPEPRATLLRALVTATAVVAATVIAVAVVNREPAAPRRTITLAPPASAPHVIAPRVEIVVPKARPLHLRRDPALAQAESLARVPTARELAIRDAVRPASPTFGPRGRVAGTVTESGKTPIAYANVVIVGARLGAMTDESGNFVITGVPAGPAQVQVHPLGYEKQVQTVEVAPDATATLAFDFSGSKAVMQIEEIEVSARKRIDTKSTTTQQTITSASEYGNAVSGPVDNLKETAATKAGVAPQGSEYIMVAPPTTPAHVSSPAPPPVVPTTGGSTLPNDEVYDSMFFRSYGVNPFVATDEDSLSTFAVDVDAGSYTVARRYIELGHLPPAEAVRVEEFVNYFPQGYPRFENDDFRILVDGAPSPFGRGYHLLRVGLKGREISERNRKPARLTFVIDVSGSMDRENRLELVKRALRVMVDRLRDDDRIGIVVFGTTAHRLLEPIRLGESVAMVAGVYRPADEDEARGSMTGRQSILAAIDLLHPEGSTNTEQGLELGYDMARAGFRPEANNRIVLCSDGVANEGRTGPESILARVRTEADQGIQLSTIGFGMGNYNDVLMEQLADKGDGNYYYVDDLGEAQRVLAENLTGTLQTIAKDAKIQVEFHAGQVLRYRLLGFENRDVRDRDFRNDKVDAGEIGAGHEVTALYEVKLAPAAKRGPLATVRLRYARPERGAGGGAPQVREIAANVSASQLSRRFEDASPRFRLDAAVAEFAEILRGSYWAKESKLSDVLPVARSAKRALRDDAAAGFVDLVEKAIPLSPTLKPEERVREP
jgi:Ca-activated chloride channel homolog